MRKKWLPVDWLSMCMSLSSLFARETKGLKWPKTGLKYTKNLQRNAFRIFFIKAYVYCIFLILYNELKNNTNSSYHILSHLYPVYFMHYFSSNTCSTKWILLSPLYNCGTWGPEKLCRWTEVIQPVSRRLPAWVQECRAPMTILCPFCRISSVQSLSHVRLFETPWTAAGLPVYHQLTESTQTHVHWVSDAIQPSRPLSSPSPPTFNLSHHQGLFKWVSSSF